MIPKLSDRYRVSEVTEIPNFFSIVEVLKHSRIRSVAYATNRTDADELAFKLNQLETLKRVCYPTLDME